MGGNKFLALYRTQLWVQCTRAVKKIMFSREYLRRLYTKVKRHLARFYCLCNKGRLNPQAYFPPAIPEWALAEMRDLGQNIDPAIYPTGQFISECKYYTFPVAAQPGIVYGELIKQCSSPNYTHCFAIPWLKRGGADLVSLLHIQLIAKCPRSRVLVLLTEPGDSPWLAHIPEQVDIINIASYQGVISHDELLLVMVRLMLQLKIQVFHIINSRHAWEVISKFGLALTQNTRIYASIYCDDYDKVGKPVGFAREYLLHCYPYIQKIFTDNSTFPALLHQCYGFPNSLFRVIKTPCQYNPSHVIPKLAPRVGGNKVLWAGRLDRQKRPDILLAIALIMPDIEFHVYGDSLLEGSASLHAKMKNTPNMHLHGEFDGVHALPFSDFPVFLYTSAWDGTPTILLAAAAASIPIVASSHGGISEIITEKTGYPIEDIECIDNYVEALRSVFLDAKEAHTRALKAQKYIQLEHTKEHFERSLKETNGYCLV